MIPSPRKLILHVGTEKTGTTSIQHALAMNRNRLRAEGILFPRCLGPVNHTSLAAACLDDGVYDNIKAHILASRNLNETEFRDHLRGELHKELTSGVTWKTLIVSTELVHSRLTSSDEIRRLFQFFEPYVDKTEIVLFLRRQDDLALSRFSSALRAGYSGFDDILEDIGAHYYLDRPAERNVNDFEQYYDYRRLVERFTDFVDPADIHIGLYQDLSAEHGVLGAFFEKAGIRHGTLVTSSAKMNSAISAEAQYILSALNSKSKPWYPNGLRNREFKDLQTEIENRYKGSRRQVARQEAQEFFDRFAESNEWLRSRFFLDRKSLFDADFAKYPVDVDYSSFETDLAGDIAEYESRAKDLPPHPPSRLSRLVKTVSDRLIGKFLKIPRSRNDKLTSRLIRSLTKPYFVGRKYSSLRRQLDSGGDVTAEFALVRILGSDHYPRHSTKQTLTNLSFILENEPQFPDCKKFFVVNRIFDKDAEREIVSLLEYHGADYVQIPFDPAEYAKANWDTQPFGGDSFFSSKAFRKLNDRTATQARIYAAAPKIRYAMNLNAARNLALERGATFARWILPLDGNCVLTPEAFELFSKSTKSYPHVPYIVVPMLRLDNNEGYFDFGGSARTSEEPQIAIHRAARERFDERYPYGVRDKAELLVRLGVPGAWQRWRTYFWYPKSLGKSPDYLRYKFTKGTVLRLSAGMQSLEKSDSHITRHNTRNTSIIRTLGYLDSLFGCRDSVAENVIFGSEISENHEQLD